VNEKKEEDQLLFFCRSQDLLAALKAAARIKDDAVLVDLLGAILERK